jgi:hypothetical protein
MGYAGLAGVLHAAFGMSWSIYDTSGGNYCLRAVTETGHWVHITDAYESLSTLCQRVDAEADGGCLGFGVSVFADAECGGLVYANEDPFAVSDADVVALVRDALENLRAVSSA